MLKRNGKRICGYECSFIISCDMIQTIALRRVHSGTGTIVSLAFDEAKGRWRNESQRTVRVYRGNSQGKPSQAQITRYILYVC